MKKLGVPFALSVVAIACVANDVGVLSSARACLTRRCRASSPRRPVGLDRGALVGDSRSCRPEPFFRVRRERVAAAWVGVMGSGLFSPMGCHRVARFELGGRRARGPKEAMGGGGGRCPVRLFAAAFRRRARFAFIRPTTRCCQEGDESGRERRDALTGAHEILSQVYRAKWSTAKGPFCGYFRRPIPDQMLSCMRLRMHAASGASWSTLR